MIKKNFFIKPDKGTWTNKMEAEMMASLIALRKAIRGNNIKHALSFHSSISKAKIFANNQSAFTELFPNYWNLDAFHVSGKMNTSERDKIIKIQRMMGKEKEHPHDLPPIDKALQERLQKIAGIIK